MASAKSFQSAETYLAGYQGNTDLVTVARRRALELRAEAGEATLKLSERAADSAEAVLRAAALLQNLSECMYSVSADIKDAKTQISELLSQVSGGILDNKSTSIKKEISEPAPPPPMVKRTSLRREASVDRATQFFDMKRKLARQRLAAAASSSQAFLTSLGAASDALKEELDRCCQESLAQGWSGRFPRWSSDVMNWFVEKHFFPETLPAVFAGTNNTRGEMLTEEQWQNLGLALREVFSHMDSYDYLFLAKVEPGLHYLVATLLQRARQDLGTPIRSDFEDASHPLRRSLVRIMYLLASHKLVAESVAPIVLIRCSIYLQEVDQRKSGEVRLAMNDLLVKADLCI